MFGIEQLTKAVEALTAEVRAASIRLESAMEGCAIALDSTTQALNNLVDAMVPPPNPVGFLRARLLREENGMLVYEFDLPQLDDPNAANAQDITHGRMLLLFDGEEQPEIMTEKGALVSPEVKIAQGVEVGGDFAFVDDAGNISLDPVELTPFTASDTVPPPNPVGGFGARMLREEPD